MSAVVRRLDAGAVAAGDEGVWTLGLDSSLARIDPATAAVDKRIRVAANTLSAIAVGAGAVWAAAPYDGTVWRVDPEPRVVQRTIDVGMGVTDVAYGLGSVWALNSLRGTVSRIDPETNRVVAKVALGNTPRQIAVGAGGVWVTVAGAAGAPVAAAGEVPEGGPALPAATCGRVFYGGTGVPDRLIVSDMPLRGGGSLPTLQMSEAIAHVLRQRGFRAGRLRIGYQSCDDSTAQAGIADEEKCAANAKLYADTPAVIGVIGPYNSYCAIGQIPIANRARLAMISPTNSDVALTHPTPLAPEGHLEDLYPTGERNYVRVYPREDAQAAAAALFARDARAPPSGRPQRRRLRRGIRLLLRARGAQARTRRRLQTAMEAEGRPLRPARGRRRAGRPRRGVRRRTVRCQWWTRHQEPAREAVAGDGADRQRRLPARRQALRYRRTRRPRRPHHPLRASLRTAFHARGATSSRSSPRRRGRGPFTPSPSTPRNRLSSCSTRSPAPTAPAIRSSPPCGARA